MKYTVTCGPFVGSFFDEIFLFRPFVQWIQTNIIYENLFVFTHYNRSFMYDVNVLPIYEQYSIDDTRFFYHRNKDINTKLYNLISKSLKKDVLKITKKNARNIISLFDKYPKTKINYSIYNKKFYSIPIPDLNIKQKDYILYIPIKTFSHKKQNKLIKILQNKYDNVIVLDDLIDDYFNMYEYIIKIIDNAKIVVCPLSDWTFICNLQKKPVISWGKGSGQYKKENIYGFNNKNYIFESNDMNHIINIITKTRNEIC